MLKALRTFPHELVWLGVVWISLSCVESFTPWSPFLKLFKFTSSMDLRIWIDTILPRLWHGGMINILYYNDRDGDIIEVDSNTNPCYWTNRWICNINEDLILPLFYGGLRVPLDYKEPKMMQVTSVLNAITVRGWGSRSFFINSSCSINSERMDSKVVHAPC